MGVELVTTGVRGPIIGGHQPGQETPGDDIIIGESQYWDGNNIDLATRKLSRDSF